ncbi:hypothetical protein XELAEV_18010089mg, partial [Xenopus laevis]
LFLLLIDFFDLLIFFQHQNRTGTARQPFCTYGVDYTLFHHSWIFQVSVREPLKVTSLYEQIVVFGCLY